MNLKLSPEAIKQLRTDAGLNQTEFWGRVGITQSGGSRYESGRDIPDIVQRLLLLTYGSEEEAQAVLRLLRTGKMPGSDLVDRRRPRPQSTQADHCHRPPSPVWPGVPEQAQSAP